MTGNKLQICSRQKKNSSLAGPQVWIKKRVVGLGAEVKYGAYNFPVISGNIDVVERYTDVDVIKKKKTGKLKVVGDRFRTKG